MPRPGSQDLLPEVLSDHYRIFSVLRQKSMASRPDLPALFTLPVDRWKQILCCWCWRRRKTRKRGRMWLNVKTRKSRRLIVKSLIWSYRRVIIMKNQLWLCNCSWLMFRMSIFALHLKSGNFWVTVISHFKSYFWVIPTCVTMIPKRHIQTNLP